MIQQRGIVGIRRARLLDERDRARRGAQPITRERGRQPQPGGPLRPGRRLRLQLHGPRQRRVLDRCAPRPGGCRHARAPPRPCPASSSSARNQRSSASAVPLRIGLGQHAPAGTAAVRAPPPTPPQPAGDPARTAAAPRRRRGWRSPPGRAAPRCGPGPAPAPPRSPPARARAHRAGSPAAPPSGRPAPLWPPPSRRRHLDVEEVDRRPRAAGLDRVQAQRAQHGTERRGRRFLQRQLQVVHRRRQIRRRRPRTCAPPRSGASRRRFRRGRRPPRPSPAPPPPTARASGSDPGARPPARAA